MISCFGNKNTLSKDATNIALMTAITGVVVRNVPVTQYVVFMGVPNSAVVCSTIATTM